MSDSKSQSEAPERIFVEHNPHQHEILQVSEARQASNDTEYVRADKFAELEQENKRLRNALEEVEEQTLEIKERQEYDRT